MAFVAPLSDAAAVADAERRARVERRLSASPLLAVPLRRLGYDSREPWAWRNYLPSVLAFAEQRRSTGPCEGSRVRVLEIGGGRGPLMTPREAESAGLAYTVNDVDARELALGPAEFAKVQFDVAGAVDPAMTGRYDLVISSMVLEHVRDSARAWANTCDLLAPGGIALAFHPTLYAPAFVINWLAPEALTAPVLRYFFSNRHDADYPKFPACYDLCTADPAVVAPVLRRAGFSQILCAPFWGDDYFRRLPGLREANAALSALAEARDWRRLTSYAYTIAAK